MKTDTQLPAELEEQRKRVAQVIHGNVTSERFCKLLDGLVLMKYHTTEAIKDITNNNPQQAMLKTQEINRLFINYISPLYNWFWHSSMVKQANDPLQDYVGRFYRDCIFKISSKVREVRT